MTAPGTGTTPLRLRVDRPANGGAAVGRTDDGRVVFVSGAIPGERVDVRVVDKRRDAYWRAETVDVVDASPHRVVPLCPAAAHGAGCCDLAFCDPGHARSLKAQVLADVLTRIGGLSMGEVRAAGLGDAVQALSADDTGWRIRARLGVSSAGVPGQYARHGSDVVSAQRCAQPDASLRDALESAAPLTPGAEVVGVLDADGAPHVTELESVTATRRRGRSRDRRARAQRHRWAADARHRQRVLLGAPAAEHRVGRRAWQIPVVGFWQAHRDAPAVYARAVADLAAVHGGTRRDVCWDLYGGAGVFAGALLDEAAAGHVHLVDTDGAALAAARGTFTAAEVTTHRGQVADVVGRLPAPGVVICDPPRTGAGARVIDKVAAAAPDVVVHIGCDAGRFARDVAAYRAHGYRLTALRAFDAFPLTHHVEAIAVLTRTRPDIVDDPTP